MIRMAAGRDVMASHCMISPVRAIGGTCACSSRAAAARVSCHRGSIMDFGVFDHLDRYEGPLTDYYEARLRLIELYDQAGFFGYHVAEHHATPLGMAPSPSVFLAAVAQRTRRLRFGPMVYALPLYHPLRMIEEICMLDQLSHGRLDIGFGRGSSPTELSYYGQDPDQAQAVYAEALEIILKGLTQPSLTHHGKFFQFDNVPMELT